MGNLSIVIGVVLVIITMLVGWREPLFFSGIILSSFWVAFGLLYNVDHEDDRET